ncbi:MAG: winged helix-turn-helix domain-containing protein [Acidobacteriota bacterium]|nr:winged helix-turn-helix domain-containing protein [Blastocatellia bacterium]MDW8238796.1 winged helix-turn-helix domain-containing protein [Acidobacteriota bacterium]
MHKPNIVEGIGQTLYFDGYLYVDYEGFVVQCGGVPVQLTRQEFLLLRLLMTNAGRVLTREFLLNTLWQGRATHDPRTLDVHVSRLRRKLGLQSGHNYIQTLIGVGYRFIPLTVSQTEPARRRQMV